jgi:hypothetical protein
MQQEQKPTEQYNFEFFYRNSMDQEVRVKKRRDAVNTDSILTNKNSFGTRRPAKGNRNYLEKILEKIDLDEASKEVGGNKLTGANQEKLDIFDSRSQVSRVHAQNCRGDPEDRQLRTHHTQHDHMRRAVQVERATHRQYESEEALVLSMQALQVR